MFRGNKLGFDGRFVPVGSIIRVCALILLACLATVAQRVISKFTVSDDIGLNRLDDSVVFSPDRRWFFVLSERGRSDVNRPESSLRIYRAESVDSFVLDPKVKVVLPGWVILRSTYTEGPIISDVRWLADSTGLVFLSKTATGNNQLFLATLRARTIVPLTPKSQHVTGFDVKSARRFVYTALSPLIRTRAVAKDRGIETVATGQSLASLIFPEERWNSSESPYDLSELWVVLNGKQLRVQDAMAGSTIPIHQEGQRALTMSPDGRKVVTVLSVKTVPPRWEALYKPSTPSSPYRVRGGSQDPNAFSGQNQIGEYVSIDVATGTATPLTDAPIGNTAGWVGVSSADWSADGQRVVLSDTFINPSQQAIADPVLQPCVAIVEVSTHRASCVDSIKGIIDPSALESWRVYCVRFDSRDGHSVIVNYSGHLFITYERSHDGTWTIASSRATDSSQNPDISAFIKEDLNDPPLLVAVDKRSMRSRVIWDPNPQLKNIRLGQVRLFRWKDHTGHDWEGGLYLPPEYVPGKRYPVVIQTHGFEEHSFRPSGAFTTTFAAQELAGSGLVVLQVEDCGVRDSPEEGTCQVAGYEAAVQQLSAMGLIDRERVGIIGFSRTCYYVLQALTASNLQFKAASITDGVNEGYLQYMTRVDENGNALAREYESMIGAVPFGQGLQQWIKQSPDFNMERVDTPLQVVALGRRSVLFMWEPYAALRFLKRPVDLVLINSDEHILSNPDARAISQGNTVDWFRFWLQGYEDPDPRKSRRYRLWRRMREAQGDEDTAAEAKTGQAITSELTANRRLASSRQ
jgi:dipeptidyl aminopeptidase/acylaminoacyl peptidase